MKPLFVVGLLILILGVASLFVPIPRNERAGIEVGGVGIGVQTTHRETVSPIVSGVLILAGAGMMIAGKGKSR
jgi:hypothetical protein